MVASYDEAVEFCANRNSNLAILKRVPMRLFVRFRFLSPYFDFLIGFNRFVNNTWLWIDGESDIRKTPYHIRKFMITLFCEQIQKGHVKGKSLQISNFNTTKSYNEKSVLSSTHKDHEVKDFIQKLRLV